MLTRWSPALALFMSVITALPWVIPLAEAVRGDRTDGERIVLGVMAAVLAFPFLWVCWRVPKVLRGMGIEIDAEGIHPFDGMRTGTIPWHQIAAVGFGGYVGRYRGGTTRRLSAFEVYLTDVTLRASHPGMDGDWHSVAPPESGLSAGCFRFTVSPYGQAAERIERAVARHRPQAWRGPFSHSGPGQRGRG